MLHCAARGQREDLLALLVERCCPEEHQLAAVDEARPPLRPPCSRMVGGDRTTTRRSWRP